MSFINVETKKIALSGKKPNTGLTSALGYRMFLHVQDTFDQEGPGWTPLKAKTRRQRVAQGFGEGPILNRKRLDSLRRNIVENSNETQVVVGVKAGIKYARIHQFGGIINRVLKAGMVRLRTTRSGKLERQEKYPKLAIFARSKDGRKGKAHKTFKSVNYEGGKNYKIVIPQRKYLFFTDKLMSDLKQIVIDFINK